MIFSIINRKKGFTLMELLVTVILVAILASYSVYYYNNTIAEGKLNAAKGKLAALGGAFERYKIENITWETHATAASKLRINPDNMSGACDLSHPGEFYNVFRCGYADKNLGMSEDMSFFFGHPSLTECGGVDVGLTVFLVPDETNSVNPKCAYFSPNEDKVIEVR